MALTNNIPVLNLTVQAADGLHINTELLYCPQQELIKTPLALQATKTLKSRNFFDYHIFIALHYPDFNPPNGRRGFLTGPKNDYGLLIETFGYEKDKFTCIIDFDYRLPNGEVIPKAKATKRDILDRIRLAMQQRKPGERVLLHYAGHSFDGRAIVASDWKGISGRELLKSLTTNIDPTIAITFVSDSCASEASLGLPYTYKENDDYLEVQTSLSLDQRSSKKSSKTLLANPIFQISGSPSGKSSFSADFSDGGYNGQLTRHFVRYFQKNDSKTQIGDIIHFMNKRLGGHRFSRCEDQNPCFSSSVDLTESFPCF